MEFILAIGLILILLELRNWQQVRSHKEVVSFLECLKDEHEIMSGSIAEALKRYQDSLEKVAGETEVTRITIEDLKKDYEIKIRNREEERPIDGLVGY